VTADSPEHGISSYSTVGPFPTGLDLHRTPVAAFYVIKQHWAVQLATNTVMLSGPE